MCWSPSGKVSRDGDRKIDRIAHNVWHNTEETEMSVEDSDVVRSDFQFPQHKISNNYKAKNKRKSRNGIVQIEDRCL